MPILDIKKINKWIDNVTNFDGENLSIGGLRTLADIKKEINKVDNKMLNLK